MSATAEVGVAEVGLWIQQYFMARSGIGIFPLACITFPSTYPYLYVIKGPWQVAWNPPLTSEPTPTPAAGACLTLDKWNQLSQGNDPLPSGLGGKIITTVNEGGLLPAIYISNLDGTNSRKIDVGAWPSLSADGTRLAYSIGDGIHVFNLSTGENPAIGTDGYRIIWSPDNTRMMFTTTFTLNVVNADGSGLQKIDTGSAQVISPSGWLSDNQTIVYAVMGGDGFTYSHIITCKAARRKNYSRSKTKPATARFHPTDSGSFLLTGYLARTNWGIFISRLDGSDRRLVAEPEVPTAFASVWGPDSQWLIINTMNQDELQMPVLVNPFSCQSVRLHNINGSIEGWSP